jgi:hypothetical protein
MLVPGLSLPVALSVPGAVASAYDVVPGLGEISYDITAAAAQTGTAMFYAMDTSFLVSRGGDIGAVFVIAIAIFAAFWAARRVLNVGRSFFSG